jgi:hypothetical protein
MVIGDLSDNAHALLRFLVFRSRTHWHIEDFACFRNAWSEPEIVQGLSDLVNSGLVGVSFEREHDKDVYFEFDENRHLIREILGFHVQDPLAPTSPPSVTYSSPTAWRSDALTLLGYCGRTKVQLTKRDRLHNRDLKSLDPLLLGHRLRNLYRRFCGTDFHWIDRLLDFLRRNHAIEFKRSRIAVTPNAFQDLVMVLEKKGEDPLSLPIAGVEERGFEADAADVCGIVIDARRKPHPDRSQWSSVAALEQAIYPVRDVFNSSSFPRTVQKTLFDLMVLGELELGENEEGWLWRTTAGQPSSVPGSSEFLHVQPNFEIVAATSLPLEDRCVLEQIAELVSIDEQLCHYRITRDSVYQGLCKGWSAERQIDYYKRQTGGRRPLPQNVTHSIESWGASFGRLSLELPLLLVCDSPKFAEELYHSKEISQYCLGRFSQNAVLVRRETAEEVLDALREMGLLPNPEIGNGLRWSIEVREERDRQHNS